MPLKEQSIVGPARNILSGFVEDRGSGEPLIAINRAIAAAVTTSSKPLHDIFSACNKFRFIAGL
jgi:hypothetical protein